jgi:hypothetical protein
MGGILGVEDVLSRSLREMPTLPKSKGLTMWTYEQNTGKLLSPNGDRVGMGYAGGNCGANPEGVNNHAMQSVHDVGPLPVGIYTIGELIPHSELGPDVLPLLPAATNVMFGRGHFFMHGDSIAKPGCGSKGCIVMPHGVRMAVAESLDKELEVLYA